MALQSQDIFPFFSLSRELRDTVYTAALREDEVLIVDNAASVSETRITAINYIHPHLLRIDHMFKSEYLEVCKSRMSLRVQGTLPRNREMNIPASSRGKAAWIFANCRSASLGLVETIPPRIPMMYHLYILKSWTRTLTIFLPSLRSIKIHLTLIASYNSDYASIPAKADDLGADLMMFNSFPMPFANITRRLSFCGRLWSTRADPEGERHPVLGNLIVYDLLPASADDLDTWRGVRLQVVNAGEWKSEYMDA